MKFALVIPALNEEDAIASTLRRALAAREKVYKNTPVTEMVIVFVNDGSTDRTQKIVDQAEFKEVVKVRFVRNRGYGAAIKAGWQAADADLVGFIDADGTCDPDFCVQLINRLEETKADVVLAARLNPQSKMPLIRKIGNRIFATLLGLVSGNDLTDTASGFRVVRRSSLRLLSPLPDGLHFTPAMSCICLLDPRLRIEEVPMPYEERIGRSKLSVVKDGFRFLYTILFSACSYGPLKTFLGTSVLLAVGCGILSWIVWALFDNRVAAWMGIIASVALMALMITTGVVCHQLNFLLIGPRRGISPAERLLQQLLDYKRLIVGGMVALFAGVAALFVLGFVGFSISHLGGAILLLLALSLTVGGGAAVLGGVIVRIIWAVGEKQKALIYDSYPVRSPQEIARATSGELTLSEALVNGPRPPLPERGTPMRASA